MEDENKEPEKKDSKKVEAAKELLEENKALVEEFKKANEEKKALLEREEQIISHNNIAGRAEAGSQPTKPVEETPREYAARILSETRPQ